MDRIKEEFRKNIRELADQECEKADINLRKNLEKELPQIVKSFHECILKVIEKYLRIEKNKSCRELAWVYVSWLRSSILTYMPCMRIDCYDSDGRISDSECAGYWEFSYIWENFHEICRGLKREFQLQTKVKEYELDDMILELAERFYKLIREFMPSVLQQWLEQFGNQTLGGQNVTFMAGEFLDRAEFILRWDKDHIEWQQQRDSD